jgi:hypothetical protein
MSIATRFSEKEADEFLLRNLIEVKEKTGWSNGEIMKRISSMFSTFDYYKQLYQPSNDLLARLNDYDTWLDDYNRAKQLNNKKDLNLLRQQAGALLEEIVLLAFLSLEGHDSVKSFQSYASQHDLLVSGSTGAWSMIIELLHLPQQARTFLVEVKNTHEKVSDAQFSRLCSIMHLKLDTTCALGIFVSREGATGFPERASIVRQRSLKDSRATQALFHAKTGKFVIVLDQSDIEQLPKEGALIRILEAKVRDVEESSGLELKYDEQWIEIDLPHHLAKYS